MAAFLNNCRFNPTTGGTTDWTFSSALTGYQTPTLAGASNSVKYKFMAIASDLVQWEIAEGAYNTGVFARTTVLYNSAGTGTAAGQSGAGTKINFTTAPQVAIIGIKEDLLAFDELNSFTSGQQEQARINLLTNRVMVFTGTLVETHAGNAVTFAVKTLIGNDPSVTTPVVFVFQNGAGGIAFVSVTAALSITVPSGATLGQPNAKAFRVWIAAFNDAGTVRLAVRTNSTGASVVVRPVENRPSSSTLTPSNSANVFYTTGAAVTSKYWAWLGHATYESGLVTAGTWVVAPDALSLIDASSLRPGEVVQDSSTTGTGFLAVSDTAGPYDVLTLGFTLSSAADNVEVEADAQIYYRVSAGGAVGILTVWRDATSIAAAASQYFQVAATDALCDARPHAFDRPNTTAAVTYKVRAQNNSSGAGLMQYTVWNLRVREIYT